MKKVLVTSPVGGRGRTFWSEENVKLANELFDVVWNEKDVPMSREEMLEKIEGCEACITLWGSPRLDAEALEKGKEIKLLTHLAGTVTPFVSQEMWDRGVKVISGNSYFARSVAEGVIGYMLAALRDIPRYERRLHEQKVWKKESDWNEGLRGKTVGLVSYGEIARDLVPMLDVFGVKMKVYDIVPLPQADVEKYGLVQASLEEIFSGCDIISLHTPLYEATRHLIGEELLKKIKPGALFVNTSRGAVVDQRALERELETGRFRAVLDVYEEEPPLKDNPLYGMDNVLMMPHMGGPTVDLHELITHDLLLETAEYLENGGELKDEITETRAKNMSLS